MNISFYNEYIKKIIYCGSYKEKFINSYQKDYISNSDELYNMLNSTNDVIKLRVLGLSWRVKSIKIKEEGIFECLFSDKPFSLVVNSYHLIESWSYLFSELKNQYDELRKRYGIILPILEIVVQRYHHDSYERSLNLLSISPVKYKTFNKKENENLYINRWLITKGLFYDDIDYDDLVLDFSENNEITSNLIEEREYYSQSSFDKIINSNKNHLNENNKINPRNNSKNITHDFKIIYPESNINTKSKDEGLSSELRNSIFKSDNVDIVLTETELKKVSDLLELASKVSDKSKSKENYSIFEDKEGYNIMLPKGDLISSIIKDGE
jgi:hypothetical protein